MGLSDLNRETIVQLYLSKSDRTLKNADQEIENQCWSSAANRLYYSAFYAVAALFVNDGFPVNSHRGAKTLLSKEYVLTKKLDPSNARILAQLETLRDKADYDIIFEASEKDIAEFRPQVDEFINSIKGLIK